MTLWFNPRCSKARAARDLLAERDVPFVLRDYLAEPPSVPELERLLECIGVSDAHAIARAKEPQCAALALEGADCATVLAAIAEHPILLERPIAVRGERAVVARPPERLLELL